MAKGKHTPEDGSDRVIENRRAHFDYAIGETLECGIKLHGPEVKSVREGKVSLQEGFVRADVTPPSLWLHQVNIAEYGPAGRLQDAPTRTRKLLAHKQEILRMLRATEAKGATLVPLKLYFKNGYAKLLIGVGIGRKKADKRQAIAERESKREIARAMSRRQHR
ncbi:MAG: SsrA-binding protein SmpB [Planctomycetaceae bacterium]|jgi:SsrA-binding protein|nr:SsrA-binding protein SmpB [Phycisphaerales bacterium]MCE2652250.1 SsrA-binding protein SmpB [Planctomycetaceae bacterium]